MQALLLTRLEKAVKLKEKMKNGRHIFGIALCVLLLGASASGVSRKPKTGGDNKAKVADTVKQGQAVPDSAKKAVPTPTVPAKKGSTVTKQVTPAKFNDFRDENKNGIDDRLEKTSTEAKKPSSTATKKTETKKTESKEVQHHNKAPATSKKSK